MVTVESTRRKYKKLLELHMKVPQKALRLIFFLSAWLMVFHIFDWYQIWAFKSHSSSFKTHTGIIYHCNRKISNFVKIQTLTDQSLWSWKSVLFHIDTMDEVKLPKWRTLRLKNCANFHFSRPHTPLEQHTEKVKLQLNLLLCKGNNYTKYFSFELDKLAKRSLNQLNDHFIE